MYEGGKNFQIGCIAHILDLIVKHGLKEHKYSVDCVQKTVRYIRHLTQRITRFKKCLNECGLQTKKFLYGGCPTRWNSTYEMLKVELELRQTFIKYEVEGIFLFKLTFSTITTHLTAFVTIFQLLQHI